MPLIVDAEGGIIAATDLASYLRNPSLAEEEALQQIVTLTNGLVGEVVGDLEPVPVRVQAIALEVGARAWRNPEGYSSETIDDYTYRRDADTRRAGVYLTDSERAELQGIVGGRAVRSVRLVAYPESSSGTLPTP